MTAVEKPGCWQMTKRYGKAQTIVFWPFLPIFFHLEACNFPLCYLSIYFSLVLPHFFHPALLAICLFYFPFFLIFFFLSIFTFFGGDLATPGWSCLDWAPSRIGGETSYQSCLLDWAIKIEKIEISEDTGKPFLHCRHENYMDVSVTPNWRINCIYLNLRVLLLLEEAE